MFSWSTTGNDLASKFRTVFVSGNDFSVDNKDEFAFYYINWGITSETITSKYKCHNIVQNKTKAISNLYGARSIVVFNSKIYVAGLVNRDTIKGSTKSRPVFAQFTYDSGTISTEPNWVYAITTSYLENNFNYSPDLLAVDTLGQNVISLTDKRDSSNELIEGYGGMILCMMIDNDLENWKYYPTMLAPIRCFDVKLDFSLQGKL